jgi:hypothetical protein
VAKCEGAALNPHAFEVLIIRDGRAVIFFKFSRARHHDSNVLI